MSGRNSPPGGSGSPGVQLGNNLNVNVQAQQAALMALQKRQLMQQGLSFGPDSLKSSGIQGPGPRLMNNPAEIQLQVRP